MEDSIFTQVFGEVLQQNSTAIVWQRGSRVILQPLKSWSPATARVASRFGVKALSLHVDLSWADTSLSFLERLPQLEALVLSGPGAINWSKVESLTSIRDLYLNCYVGTPGEINLSGLAKLKVANINSLEQWDSILACRSLRVLSIREVFKLKTLNLTKLKSLRELAIIDSPSIEDVELARGAKLKALRISKSKRVKPPWGRIRRELEYLTLDGRLGFPLSEVRHAENLKRIELFQQGMISLAPLRRLSKLKKIAPGWGTKFNRADANWLADFYDQHGAP